MDKKRLGIIAGILVIVGVGFYLYTSSDQSGTVAGVETTSSQFSGTLVDLAARGGSYECTIKKTIGTTDVSGTVYEAGGMVRGDLSSLAGEVAVMSHVLMRDGTVYTWTDIAPNGFKATVTGTGAGQYANADESFAFDCKSTAVDPAHFDIPTTITFSEVGKE